MSGIDTLAIIAAIRERIIGVDGGIRSVADERLADGVYASLPDAEKARRAGPIPRVDVRIVSITRHGVAVQESGNTQTLRIDVRVTCIYAITPAMKAGAVGNDDCITPLDVVRARAIDDAELVRQSLMWPGALVVPQSFGGLRPTGIVSGCLMAGDTGAIVVRESAGADAALLETEQAFWGLVRVAPATS